MAIIKIICPVCGAMLKLNEAPGLESKNVKCPVCNTTTGFKDFRRVADNPTDPGQKPKPRPHAPNFNPAANAADDDATKMLDESTRLNQARTTRPGALRSGSLVFPLQMGQNIIGRQCSSQQPTIQLPCPENKRMSRKHLVIDVATTPDGGLSHVASLYKQQTNSTYINGQQLMFGNRIVLNNGDRITLPNFDLEVSL